MSTPPSRVSHLATKIAFHTWYVAPVYHYNINNVSTTQSGNVRTVGCLRVNKQSLLTQYIFASSVYSYDTIRTRFCQTSSCDDRPSISTWNHLSTRVVSGKASARRLRSRKLHVHLWSLGREVLPKLSYAFRRNQQIGLFLPSDRDR